MILVPGDGPVLAFGGPYSNMRALAALRARAEALCVSSSRIICTGDVVAYCVELGLLVSCSTPGDDASWDKGKMWKDWDTVRSR